MLRTNLVLAGSSVLLAALALGGCSGGPSAGPTGSPPSSSAPASSPSAPESSPSAGAPAAFCAELVANGASGPDFGAIPTFYPRDELLDDVRGKLAAMGDATPPAEIADAWELQKTTLEKVEAAAKKLPSGGRLSGARYAFSDEVVAAEKTLTDYWFASCR